MNDIEEASTALNSILFADDSTFITSINAVFPNIKIDYKYEQNINIELEKIYNWLAVNKLSLNVRKTKFMIFHTPGTRLNYIPKVSINGIDLERVSEFNFLGLTIQENLSWKSHAEKIANKISKYNGVLSRLKHYLPSNILRMIYCSVIQSNMNYSLLAWGYENKRVVKLQKKAIRNITASKYNAHTEPLFKELCLLKINDILKLNALKFFYKLKNNQVPLYFYGYNILTQEELHGRDTRFNQMYALSNTRTILQKKCLRNFLPELLNTIPKIILDKIDSHSYKGFANYCKQYYLNNYSKECDKENCYICENS